MSTLSVGTIQSNTSAPPVIQNSSGTEIGTLCRAWVNFNGNSGASPVIRASFNVSSVTRNAAGDYTVSFTNVMPDTNYSIGLGNTLYSSTSYRNSYINYSAITTSGFGVLGSNAASGNDIPVGMVQVFR